MKIVWVLGKACALDTHKRAHLNQAQKSACLAGAACPLNALLWSPNHGKALHPGLPISPAIPLGDTRVLPAERGVVALIPWDTKGRALARPRGTLSQAAVIWCGQLLPFVSQKRQMQKRTVGGMAHWAHETLGRA
jgi:hypothetical protein